MERLWAIIGFAAMASALIPCWRARRALRPSTLYVAWFWAVAALLAWTLITAGGALFPQRFSGWFELARYLATMLTLSPAISVLGAQRPVARIWSWFVVAPFLLVFGWPVAASWEQAVSVGQFDLETPMAVGFVFVVIMGLGNYVGSRFTFPALLTGVALSLVVLPLATAQFSWLPSRETAHALAPFLLSGAIWWADRSSRQNSPVRIPLDRVWIDFRDWYGIVWSKRILDRLNHQAETEKNPARMSLTGVVYIASPEAIPAPDDIAAIERTLRWLLRRFVDESWIDQRLELGATTDVQESV